MTISVITLVVNWLGL